MSLVLVPITDAIIATKQWSSPYGNGGAVPTRMRWLVQEARDTLPSKLVMTDVYRSPISSLHAIEEKRGTLYPGYSRHNFGEAIDLDVDATMRLHGFKAKKDLDGYMAASSWYCHRSDHQRGSEDWHMNYLPNKPAGTYSSDEGEARLVAEYGAEWDVLRKDLAAEQTALAAVGMYEGKIDGVYGTMTENGRKTFKRTWVVATKAVYQDYERVLWLVAQSKKYT